MRIVKAGLREEVIALLESVDDHCILLTPHISHNFSDLLIKYVKPQVSIKILIQFSNEDIDKGSLNFDFINKLESNFNQLWIGVLRNLDAQLYVFDSSTALLTSADPTYNGVMEVEEYGTIYEQAEELVNINTAVNELMSDAIDFMQIRVETNQTSASAPDSAPEPEPDPDPEPVPEPVPEPDIVSHSGSRPHSQKLPYLIRGYASLQPFTKGQEAELIQQIEQVSPEGKNINLQAHYRINGIPEGVYAIVYSDGSITEYSLDRIDNHIRVLGEFSEQIDEHDLHKKA